MKFEGGGKFTAFNANTDRAGLSFGLILWAQRPGRLNELLRAFRDKAPEAFVNSLGGGDAALADNLIRHTARASGGVQNETVARVTAKCGGGKNGVVIIASTRNCREAFRTTNLLKDLPFDPS